MKVLLDTNIIIHREASKIVNPYIGKLFRFLDKGKFTKCIHPVTIEEVKKNINKETVDTFITKLDSYEQLHTISKLSDDISKLSDRYDKNENDRNDSILLNEIFTERIDYFITEDRKIHYKSRLLGIEDKVFTISSFIEKVLTENPDLIEYKVLSVKRKRFGELDLSDPFFDSFKEDYKEFVKWYKQKSDEFTYVTLEDDRITSFLYLKKEDERENYSNITPPFPPKKRLKIGTFKITSTGARLSERFMKIIFDNAFRNKVEEIYVTIFNTDIERGMLINLLKEWGFEYYGKKITENGEEEVFVRDYVPRYNQDDPKLTYPYMSKNNSVFLCPIWPQYHTDLLPDSLLKTELPEDFKKEKPHRNAIKKVYISRSHEKKLNKGDVLVFYRTGGKYLSVITTLGIVENVIPKLDNQRQLISKCRKRSVFTDEELITEWNRYKTTKPFIVNFLYCYTFPHRVNLNKMIELGIIKDISSAPQGFTKISKEQFEIILRETGTDESIIVD